MQESVLRFDMAPAGSDPAEPLAYPYRVVRTLSVDVQRRLQRDRAGRHPDAERLIAAMHEDRPAVERPEVARQVAALQFLTLRPDVRNDIDESCADRATSGQEFSPVRPLMEPGRSFMVSAKARF